VAHGPSVGVGCAVLAAPHVIRKGKEFKALLNVLGVQRPLKYWRGRTSEQMAALRFDDVGERLSG
jgi:hypothetical protein